MSSWSKIAARVPVITSASLAAGWKKDQRRKVIDLLLCLFREVNSGYYISAIAILTVKRAREIDFIFAQLNIVLFV